MCNSKTWNNFKLSNHPPTPTHTEHHVSYQPTQQSLSFHTQMPASQSGEICDPLSPSYQPGRSSDFRRSTWAPPSYTHDMFPLWKSYRKLYTVYKMVDFLLLLNCDGAAPWWWIWLWLEILGDFLWKWPIYIYIYTSDNARRCSTWPYTWSTDSWTKQDMDMLICICTYWYSCFVSFTFPPVMEDIRTLIHSSSYCWINSTP